MPNALAILTLLVSPSLATLEAATVRIGLFSLFRPDAITVRIPAGEGALFEASRASGDRYVAPGDLLQLRLTGGRVRVAHIDSHGRIRRSLTTDRLEIIPKDGGKLELSITGKIKRDVRGRLRVSAGSSQSTLTIALTTDREAAVASIVAAEMTSERQPEALKAVAVVVRAYMLSHVSRHAGEGFDFCDTTHCQVYRGESDLAAQSRRPVIAAAVSETRGEYLSYGGRKIETYYTAACGGLSATPEMVWGGASAGYRYRRVACRWCQPSEYARWERRASAVSVLNAVSSAAGFRLSQSAEVTVESDDESGFVRAVVIRDRGREQKLSADEFRRAVGRRLGWNTVISPTFKLERRGPSFIFRGKGFGSQVGLCLAGASRQAAAGRSYRQILDYYYPESVTSKQ